MRLRALDDQQAAVAPETRIVAGPASTDGPQSAAFMAVTTSTQAVSAAQAGVARTDSTSLIELASALWREVAGKGGVFQWQSPESAVPNQAAQLLYDLAANSPAALHVPNAVDAVYIGGLTPPARHDAVYIGGLTPPARQNFLKGLSSSVGDGADMGADHDGLLEGQPGIEPGTVPSDGSGDSFFTDDTAAGQREYLDDLAFWVED